MHFVKETMASNRSIQISHALSNNWSMQQYHFHDSYEINLAVSGGNRFFVNDDVFKVTKGDIFLFNSQDLHKTMVLEGTLYERYLIFFDPELITPFRNQGLDLLELFHLPRDLFNCKLSLDQVHFLEIKTLLDDLLLYMNHQTFGVDTYKLVKLSEILFLLHTYYHQNVLIQEKSFVQGFDKIKPILAYINNHLGDTLTLACLSETFFINTYYLCTLFKKTTGFTVNQYITNKRILHAKKLLMEGHLVTQVAHLVGYENDSHFIRTFKKLVGVTPKQFTLKQRKS